MAYQDERTWQHEDTRWLAVIALLFAALTVGLWAWIGSRAGGVVLVAAVAVIVGMQLHLYRRRRADDVQQRRHMQALFFLFSAFDFRAPLPSLTGWAISPELAATLVTLIRTHEPDVILELGSGTSTIVMGYAVEQKGRGQVLSLDHSRQYGAQTERQLAAHALQDWTEVRHAPLKPFEQQGTTWSWYDLDAIEDDLTIDMIVIDGPPYETGTMARYPAVPALYDHLSEDAIIVLDDAYRDEERAMLNCWREVYTDFTVEFEESPTGTAVLRRTMTDPPSGAEASQYDPSLPENAEEFNAGRTAR